MAPATGFEPVIFSSTGRRFRPAKLSRYWWVPRDSNPHFMRSERIDSASWPRHPFKIHDTVGLLQRSCCTCRSQLRDTRRRSVASSRDFPTDSSTLIWHGKKDLHLRQGFWRPQCYCYTIAVFTSEQIVHQLLQQTAS